MALFALLNPAPSVLSAINRQITQLFGANDAAYPATNGHPGLDIALLVGTPLRSMGVTNGTVTNVTRERRKGSSFGYGVSLEITYDGTTDYPDGYSIRYGHMDYLALDMGDTITPGGYIGESGDTGNSTGPHVHIGLKLLPIPAQPVMPGGWVDPLGYIEWDKDVVDGLNDGDDPTDQVAGALTFNYRSKPLATQGVQIAAWIIWRTSGASIPRAEEYVSTRLRPPLTLTRGRDMSSVELGNPQMGSASFVLGNEDGRFSRNNTASPLAVDTVDPVTSNVENSSIGVGRLCGFSIWFGNQEVNLWKGIVTQIKPRVTSERLKVVDVEARGPLWIFADTDTVFDENTSSTAGDLARRIWRRTVIPTRQDIGKMDIPGVLTQWTDQVDSWNAKGTAMSLWGRLEARVLGFLNESRDGEIQAFNKTRRRKAESQASAIFSDDVLTGVTNYHICTAIRMASTEHLVFSRFNSQVGGENTSRQVASEVAAGGVQIRVWSSDKTENEIKAGQTLNLPITYSGGRSYTNEVEWKLAKTIVATMEIETVNSVDRYKPNTEVIHRIGAEQSPISSITAHEDPNDKNTIVVSIDRTALTNTSLRMGVRRIELFGIRSQEISETATVSYQINISALENLYGNREFPIVPLFTNYVDARDWAENVASQYSVERDRIEMEFRPKTGTEALALARLDLDDLIDVRTGSRTGMYVSRFMYIQRIIIDFDQQHMMRIVFHLVDQDVYAPGFNWQSAGRFYTS